MVLDAALEERIAEILRADDAALARARPEAIRASNRKQAVIPEGATVLDPVGHRARAGRAAAAGRRGPTVVVLPGPPRELQPMWETAVADRGVPRRDRRRADLPPRDPAAVRDPGVGDRATRCAPPRPPGSRSTRSRSRPACGAARSRSPRAIEPPAEPAYDALVEFIARAPRRHAVLARTARRSTSRSPRCSTGRTVAVGRVVHGRADGGAADRPRRLLGLLRRRRGRVLERRPSRRWWASTRR